MTDNVEERLIDALRQPAAYPWRPERVDHVETHISWLFFAGDRVLKVKRPVRFGFVDHATLDQRRRSCEEEVRLNRRLTNGVYLAVVPIVRAHGGLAVGEEGEPVEWATLMRRLPAERMLDRLLTDGSAPPDLAERLAARLIPFHRTTAGACGHASFGAADALAAVVRDNLAELRPFAGPFLGPMQIELVTTAMIGFLDAERDLLARRVADGWVRDGHGDLRAEHVCLEDDEVQIFDCVEFNPAIRCADVASDLSYLLMDLDRLGASASVAELETRYRAAGVELPPALIRCYRAHRALVRAKVDCLTLATAHQPHPALPAEIAAHLDLATRAALTVRPFVAAMSGLSGTGKSTVAGALARATGARLIASDVVRKELAGIRGPAGAEWGGGLYSEEWTERTYQRLSELAAAELAKGRPVILDATFLDPERRAAVGRVAAAAAAPLVIVETVCDEAVAVARLAARQVAEVSVSDATVATFHAQRAVLREETPFVPAGAVAAAIDTNRDGPVSLDPVLAALRDAGALIARIQDDEDR